jgi:soluble lytic murein transglycosylase-like protein
MKYTGLLVLALAWGPAAVSAQDFTFKRIKPPAAGVTKRITIQIEPRTPSVVAQGPAASPRTPDSAPQGQQEWFWDAISPALEPPEAGKFTRATAQLASAPAGAGITAPPLQMLHAIAAAHGQTILRHSVGTKVSPALALAVIAVESGGRLTATSSAGAQGLMQLIPATATRFGVQDATDADQNIRAGVTYLDWLLGQFYGDPMLALAGYNAGENAVRKYGGVPPFAETRAYVPKVLAAWTVARQLCITPPELPSDGCVFNLKGS